MRLFEVLSTIKGFCLVSYNDCFETRDIYKDYNIFAFSRPHSMAQRYEAGKEFKELLIANYDFYERVKNLPLQMNLFDEAEDDITDVIEDLNRQMGIRSFVKASSLVKSDKYES